MNDKVAVGEVRSSQIFWSYGPGALIDLPNLSVITMGTDQWQKDRCIPIEEARLLSAVRDVLGHQVESLRMPPSGQSESAHPYSEDWTGIPVKPFPRWLRCVRCGLLSELDLGLFKIKENRFRPEETRFVHGGCTGSSGDLPARDADAVPARFLSACRNGHLDDFPWRYFVHSGPSTCTGMLRFFESGASLQTDNLWVKCDQCGTSRNMARAFGKSGREYLPRCRGRHPHLNRYDDDCQEQARTVLLGATNSWFPITLSALAIPLSHNPLLQLVRDGWNYFYDTNSQAEVSFVVKTLKKTGTLAGIDKYPVPAIQDAIAAVRAGQSQADFTGTDIKGPEWQVLTAPESPTDGPHFMSKPKAAPNGFEHRISGVLLLERLRQVNALLGFTRVEAPESSGDPDQRPPMARLCRGAPTWVPSGQVHGEGIFIRFDEQALRRWEQRDSVQEREAKLACGHRNWRSSRKLDPDEDYPGARYTLLHTLAHLLMRELALECGYNAASIRERIYADTTGEEPQAGILIYTAAADSDGTLGGLVELGKPENLGRLLTQALARARICSSDPLCTEHEPDKDRSLHAASCHACSFVSETSCERGNHYLDRALVIPVLEVAEAAFFR